ncbi:MAG: NAD(P)-binding protein, partial [Bacteroidota bacterium]
MTNKPHTCIIIGTGFSGLAMAIQLKNKGIHDFIILEKARDIGGTWRENTYPGAECDIPSALYSFSFEPYPFWEYKWSMQPQILEYIKYVAKKYDLYPHIH